MGNYGISTGGTGSPQVTGYSNNYQANQVFDAGGNLYDWTTEVNTYIIRVLRGDFCDPIAYGGTASNRSDGYPTDTYSWDSARSTLYVTL